MRYLMAIALFLLLGVGFSAPLMAQDAGEKDKKDLEKKQAEDKPTTYKIGISGMN